MKNSNKFQFEFDLGKAGIKKFQTVEETIRWCEKERSNWDWLKKGEFQSQNFEISREITDAVNNFLSQILNTLNNATDLNQLQNYNKSINSHIRQFLLRYDFIFSGTPEFNFIEDIKQDNPRLAAYTAGAFMKLKYYQNVRESVEGHFLCFSFSYGIKDRKKSEITSFQKLYDDWNNLLNEGKTKFQGALEEYQNLQEQHVSLLNNQKNAFTTFNENSSKDFQSLLEKSEKELKNIERTYDEKLALQASVRYWKTKAESHKKIVSILTWILVIVFLFVGLVLCLETVFVIGPSQTISAIQIWKFGMLLLTAIIGVWAIRILVRILLSNIHLRSDAVERRTMLLTYLALLRSGHGPSEDKKELILQTLFRPSATGIIKDDALPPAVAQWLNLVTSN